MNVQKIKVSEVHIKYVAISLIKATSYAKEQQYFLSFKS